MYRLFILFTVVSFFKSDMFFLLKLFPKLYTTFSSKNRPMTIRSPYCGILTCLRWNCMISIFWEQSKALEDHTVGQYRMGNQEWHCGMPEMQLYVWFQSFGSNRRLLYRLKLRNSKKKHVWEMNFTGYSLLRTMLHLLRSFCPLDTS